MSKEFFVENSEPVESWVVREESLNYPTSEQARRQLADLFSGSLEEWRKNHPDEDSWAIPFTYDIDEPDDFKILGGLWIPPDHIQMVMNRDQTYVHMSAAFAMESDLMRIGIRGSNFLCNSRIDLSNEVPVVNIPSYMQTLAITRRQVEQDFGVLIDFEH